WIRLFAYPQTWAIIAGKLLIDPIYWFFLFWLPAYLSSSFNLDLTKLSPELIIIYGATTVGSIGGGYFSSLLIRKGWLAVKARKFVLLVIAVLEVSIFFTQFVSNIWAVVLIISAAVALHQAWATNIFTLASDLVSKTSVGSVVGIAGMAGAVGGILFPMLIGYLLDLYRLKGNITGGYNILFTICSVSYLAAWVLIHFLTKKAKTI
ncbi:MAG TPA: MFS transporter, partial [Chitinophagaceae bacterium]|nr:MFS transporter [Chitinophagaceae bacterium]